MCISSYSRFNRYGYILGSYVFQNSGGRQCAEARGHRAPSVSSFSSSADEAAPSPPPSSSQVTPNHLSSRTAPLQLSRVTFKGPRVQPPNTVHCRGPFEPPLYPAGSFPCSRQGHFFRPRHLDITMSSDPLPPSVNDFHGYTSSFLHMVPLLYAQTLLDDPRPGCLAQSLLLETVVDV